MVFSSVIFLFLFLPIVLLLYFSVPLKLRNLVLLGASLLFYFWGSGKLFVLIVISTLIDYGLGWCQVWFKSQRAKKWCVGVSVTANLSLLGYFKYYNFFIDNLNTLFTKLGLEAMPIVDIALPIGISFYTFQTISYQIDLYRGEAVHQRNLQHFALFVALFPQLVAGPIIRYKDIASQISSRKTTVESFLYGAYRFISGLSKKVIIADGLAPVVDQIFSTPPALLTVGAAWLGIVAFFFQIYIDFSGYSDMAIGLGSIFGFKFRENFRYPYVARSITAFWQRWHISLTTWLRDYIYRPLHHSNSSWLGRSINVYIVFTLCGLWHGANWTFIIFGLYFGTLLVLEHYYWRRFGAHWPRPLQHIYVILACLIALVFFRSLNITYAWHYLRAMFNFVGHQSLE